jgi:sulfonate transport system permease protein
MTVRPPLSWRPLLVPLLGLVAWDAAAHAGWISAQVLPTPEAVVRRLWSEAAAGTLSGDLAASLRRQMTGLAIGATAGVSLGLLLGLSRIAERLLGPLFLGYRQIALFAWVPLLSLWFGGNEAGKIAFIALAAFAPATVNSWRGARDIPRTHAELAAVLTFGRLDYLRLVALPGALPSVLTGLRSALIQSWLATIGSELFLNIAPGLGGRLNEGRETFQMDLLLACILVLAALGFTLQLLAGAGETWLLRQRTS